MKKKFRNVICLMVTIALLTMSVLPVFAGGLNSAQNSDGGEGVSTTEAEKWEAGTVHFFLRM